MPSKAQLIAIEESAKAIAVAEANLLKAHAVMDAHDVAYHAGVWDEEAAKAAHKELQEAMATANRLWKKL
jgi:hypothetical protein